MLFADDSAWADLGEMAWTNSMGFDFDETLPQVSALWRATPTGSGLALDSPD